jgi:hypothetical protein
MNLENLDPVLIVAALNTAGMALVALISLPLYLGKIRPNKLYGARLQAAFKSEAAWLQVNRYGAARLMTWSGVVVALNLIGWALPLPPSLVLVQALAFSPLLILVPCWQTWRYGKSL